MASISRSRSDRSSTNILMTSIQVQYPKKSCGLILRVIKGLTLATHPIGMIAIRAASLCRGRPQRAPPSLWRQVNRSPVWAGVPLGHRFPMRPGGNFHRMRVTRPSGALEAAASGKSVRPALAPGRHRDALHKEETGFIALSLNVESTVFSHDHAKPHSCSARPNRIWSDVSSCEQGVEVQAKNTNADRVATGVGRQERSRYSGDSDRSTTP
jgi:hypothetical protein